MSFIIFMQDQNFNYLRISYIFPLTVGQIFDVYINFGWVLKELLPTLIHHSIQCIDGTMVLILNAVKDGWNNSDSILDSLSLTLAKV